jgi:hypothetical protein
MARKKAIAIEDENKNMPESESKTEELIDTFKKSKPL